MTNELSAEELDTVAEAIVKTWPGMLTWEGLSDHSKAIARKEARAAQKQLIVLGFRRAA